MTTSLRESGTSPLTPAQLVASAGEVLACFDHRTQDSGNVSWLVRTEAEDLFVKSAGFPTSPDGVPEPVLSHSARVDLLRGAVRLARSVEHPSLAHLLSVIETPEGPVLVYERAPGELVNAPRAQREDPSTPYRRFAAAPAAVRLQVFDQLLEAHAALDAAGWVAVDLYDGCLMVDLETGRLTLIDLDTYHPGPLVNTMGRMYGSTRFMAPEEFERGATIDRRTTVFTLGRLIRHFGTGLQEDLEHFCGTPRAAELLERATRPDPAQRLESATVLHEQWIAARSAA